MTSESLSDSFDAARAANHATVKGWVEEATAGFLTCESATTITHGDALSIQRADGQLLDGRETHPSQPVTGVLFRIYVPSYRQLNRRHRSVLRELRDAVRSVLVGFVDETPDDAYFALHNFERKNHLS